MIHWIINIDYIETTTQLLCLNIESLRIILG